MMYFKVKINYSKLFKETSENKIVSETRIFKAISYKDAEEQAINYVKEYISGECECNNISKVNYEDIIRNENKTEEDLYWWEIKVTFIERNEKNEEKYSTKKYLVEAIDLIDAFSIIKKYLIDMGEWYFSEGNETLIDEVVI